MSLYSPLEIRLLLHIYAIASPVENITAPAARDAIQHFLSNDLIKPASAGTYGCEYEITDRGTKWVMMILSTPLPVFQWIDPRNYAEAG